MLLLKHTFKKLYPHLTPLLDYVHIPPAPPSLTHRTNPHTLTAFHSKLIRLSKQAPSSRQHQWVPFSVSSEKKKRLSCSQMNGVFWWSAESCLLPLHLFTSLFFKSSLRDTLPPLAQTQSPHPLNLTHQPPPSHLLLKRTLHLPNTHTYIPATPSLPPPFLIPCRSLSSFIPLSSLRLVS